MKRMYKGQVPLFFMLQKKKTEKKWSRLDCSVTYVSHLTWCEDQPDASGSTGLVLIHLSYITSCRVAAFSTVPVLSKDCAHLLSVTGCFASAASFGFCLHAPMHIDCLDNGADCLSNVYFKLTAYEQQYILRWIIPIAIWPYLWMNEQPCFTCLK